MPFAVKDVLQHKRNERQIREIHEREYLKYISTLRQQSFPSNLFHLSSEYIKEIERSQLRYLFNKNIQYERIQQENNLLTQRLFKMNKQTMIDNKNNKYQQNLDIFKSKYTQQRSNEYQRIKNENHLISQRINNVRGQVVNKQQCDQDWQRQIKDMKKSCDYPEHIDQFVSNNNTNQYGKTCKWNQRYHNIQRSSKITAHPIALLLELSK
ncbi:unnamed protein product [Adineta steineri]|uniref:Uncharacterized protein n=1 Tax=Adineta steineri TaxID=433720 RepID=A0A815R7U2_9BILA|nr:unnamed protein product [Adineta steineri]